MWLGLHSGLKRGCGNKVTHWYWMQSGIRSLQTLRPTSDHKFMDLTFGKKNIFFNFFWTFNVCIIIYLYT